MQNSGINLEKVKIENRSLILKCINDNGPISRKDIAETTGLTAASVTQITTRLINEGLLTELGAVTEKSGTAGRKKILIGLRADYGYVVSVNIESATTCVAICDITGNVACDGAAGTSLPTDTSGGTTAFLRTVSDSCKKLIKMLTKEARAKVRCVSIGIPGIVDKERGVSVRAYGVFEEEGDLETYLDKSLILPVLIENNVDAFAIAEILYGTGRTQDSLLVIKWGPGVGSTIVTGSRIYQGRHGKTAELGHFIVNKNGAKCSCGRKGCLETLLSVKALSRICEFEPEHFGEVYSALPEDKKSQIDAAIDIFARSIVNTCTIIAPGRIILSGVMFASQVIRDKLIECCMSYDPAYNHNRIIYTTLSDKAAYIGPVAVYFLNLLRDNPKIQDKTTPI